jgi:hypothetical protein
VTLTHPSNLIEGLPAPLCCSTFTYSSPIQVLECVGYSSVCTDCINTFRPQIGKYYILSAWVKQDKAEINSVTNKLSYDKATVNLAFKNSTGATVGTVLSFAPSGEIIDGWQRIEEKFIIPEGAVSVDISLKNITAVSGNDAYYDDIRIFPFDGSLKSYVYDPNSQKLVAELDENNFATIYEYDESGVLVRVKKETERGIVTIKENGSNKPKRN